jgi:hypothetical protein
VHGKSRSYLPVSQPARQPAAAAKHARAI